MIDREPDALCSVTLSAETPSRREIWKAGSSAASAVGRLIAQPATPADSH